jgi:hypothetical protein
VLVEARDGAGGVEGRNGMRYRDDGEKKRWEMGLTRSAIVVERTAIGNETR